MRIPLGLRSEQLGPIGRMLRGHRLHDVVAIHDGLLVRCSDGLELEIAFASVGAELRSMRVGVITAEITMPPALRYMRGKILENAVTREGLFYLVASDGHAVRFDWKTGQPEPRGIDAYVDVPAAPIFASAGGV